MLFNLWREIKLHPTYTTSFCTLIHYVVQIDVLSAFIRLYIFKHNFMALPLFLRCVRLV